MKRSILLMSMLFFTFLISNAQYMHIVRMVNNAFSPDYLIINQGDSVKWINEDVGPHTTASGPDCIADGGYWVSGVVNSGDFYKRKMDIAGGFQYHCEYQCEKGMLGVIVINGVSVSSVSNPADYQLKLSTFPNPFIDQIKVEFTLPSEALVKLEIRNVTGKKVFEIQELNMIAGNQSIRIVSSDFKPGIYLCNLYVNGNPSGSEYIVKVEEGN